MLDIDAYIKALECCWMGRLISNSKWVCLLCRMYPTIDQFAMYGHDFLKNLSPAIENNFWNHVVKSFISMIVNIKINSWYDFLRQPIWYNDKVRVAGKSIFTKNGWNMV